MAIRISDHRKLLKLRVKPVGQDWLDFKLFINHSILYELVNIVYREFLEKKNNNEDSMGTIWKPLSPSLAKWKIKKGLVNSSGDPLINYRTGMLEKALKPGRFANGVYRPNTYQSITVNTMSIDYWVNVDYADDVNKARPFIPIDIDPWLDEAIGQALPRIQRQAKVKGYV
jgi:hypothetical protein